MNDIIKMNNSGSLTMTLCLEEGSILLNKNVMLSLGEPQQVQLLINEEQHLLLLKACSIEDREAVIIPPAFHEQFEVNGPSLLKRIRKLTGWTDNFPRQIKGVFIPEHEAVLFNLHHAVAVILKPAEKLQ